MVELRPRRAKAGAAAEESPKKPRTPKATASTKRKAPEEVSLASTKKQKSAKCTPSKAKNIEEPEPVKKGVESTSAAKKDQAKTSNVVDLKDGQWSSSAKGKKKTPSKLNEPVVATPQMTAPKETKKTASAKGKKEKIPTKIHSATPSKELEKLILKARETCAESKETPKSPPDAVDFAPASKTPKPGKKSIEKPGSVPAPEPADKKNKPIHDIQDPDVLLHEEDGQIVFEEDDENTKALVRSLDSGDEDDFESGVVLFEEGQDVGKIPVVSKKDEKAAKKALTALRNKEDTGVIYVGRLPHGFYEHEMRSYFSQFGHICNLRVSRNKKTGKAKHFAFVEFAETSTAEIAAKTMDNYLLFGHIIKCRVIPKAQIHDDLFKGANKRFKGIPRNKKEANQLQRPQPEAAWERRIQKEQKRREQRAKKLEILGYKFDAPEVKAIGSTGKKTTATLEGEASEAPPAASSATQPSSSGEPEEAASHSEAEKEQQATLQPAKRSRGRPAKNSQKASKAAETPRKSRRTKA